MFSCDCQHSGNLPPGTCSFCPPSSPDSLLDTSVDYIDKHLDIICESGNKKTCLKLKQGIYLPAEICEKLLNLRMSRIRPRFLNIFKDKSRTRLKRVKLRDFCNKLTQKHFEILLSHELVDLDVSHCLNFTSASISNFDKYATKMTSLTIGKALNVLSRIERHFDSKRRSILFLHLLSVLNVGKNTRIFPLHIFGNIKNIKKYYVQGYIFRAPSLKRLTIKDLRGLEPTFYSLLLRNLTTLTHLDLSKCSDLDDFDYTEHLTNLTSLILYDVSDTEGLIPAICKLKTLRHLDIAQSRPEISIYKNCGESLATLMENLPKLASLDISGTNLADVRTLSGLKAPLRYVGLYGTAQDACHSHDIPSKLIAGNANEEQLLVAALAFQHHLELLLKVLKEIFQLLRAKNCLYFGQILHIVLDTMSRYPFEREVQTLGSSIVLWVAKAPERRLSGCVSLKRKILSVLLDAVRLHPDNATIMRSMISILCQFVLPDDMLFHFDRLVRTLLFPIDFHGYDKKKVLQFLNDLSCYSDIPQKIRLGDLGVMHQMISLVQWKLNKVDCDEVLELAWSVMWNATDGTPANSKIFLEIKGMEYFMACFETFPNEDDLLRDMIGLLGNVAEVQELRHHFVVTRYLDLFVELLDSKCDGIEVSFDAAGIIAYIASDGPEAWTVDTPSRSDALSKMAVTIDRWNIKSLRNIMYRTFQPILYLLKTYRVPECQKWAVWTLANLTKVYPERYCSMLEKEGGLVLIQHLVDHFEPRQDVEELANIVIANCGVFRDTHQVVDVCS